MPASNVSLESLRDIIVARFPELAGSRFVLLAEGWDSVAVDVDDRLIFKFPRQADAETGLVREARLLAAIAPAVTMPVPTLALFDSPRVFSRHAKIAGDHLLAADYAVLPERARQALGEAMAQFYAQLHAIDPLALRAAGGLPRESWLPPDEILARTWPLLPPPLRSRAERTIADWAALKPDPHGEIYGFFDGHGWNMAFDHQAQRLNGIYDFADSGFGPLHEEFIFSNFIAPDLTERIIAGYEGLTGKAIERERVRVLTGAHRLWELAVGAGEPDNIGAMLQALDDWFGPQY